VRRASRELKIPEPTVRKILRKRPQLYPYKLQLVQKLQLDDPSKRLAFCEDLLSRLETDQGLSERIILVMKRPFLSGKVNRHNIRIWGSQNPHALIEMERESQSERVLCHFQKTRVRSILLRGDSYWKCVPGHDGKLVNATTRG